jgi:anaphase-promoting complex subunit 8
MMQKLLYFFRNSNYLLSQIATSYYNTQGKLIFFLLLEYDHSLEAFEKLIDLDPYRFENMDTYSNILYIKESQGELANLALRQFNNNKYVPETCCVLGNYYSLMNEHAKAINYFQKALKLDKECLAAWTLMVEILI